MVPRSDDTICAVATPPGEGGVAIVRVSGPQAVPLVDRLVRLRSNRSLASVSSHRLYRAEVGVRADSSRPLNDSERKLPPTISLDLALVVVMRAPVAPKGWPTAIELPQTLSLSSSTWPMGSERPSFAALHCTNHVRHTPEAAQIPILPSMASSIAARFRSPRPNTF